MINVLQRLAELDAQNPRVEKPMVSEVPVLGEGIKQLDISMPEPDMKALRQLSGLRESREFSNTISECGMPGMGAPMPSTPASLSMTAASGAEIVTMMRGLADIASGGGTGMPAMGAEMPSMGGPLVAEPEHDGAHDGPATGGEMPVSGPTFGDDEGEEGADELAQMMNKLRTGQPVKISTDMPVKVKTSNPVTGGGEEGDEEGEEDDEEMEESMRQWDSSPSEQTRDYNPNDFARIFNKVKELDVTKAPRVADNPLKAESVETKEDSLAQAVNKLFAEYQQFVNEGKSDKKAKKDYDGDGEVESGKDEYMGSRDKAIKKAMAKKK